MKILCFFILFLTAITQIGLGEEASPTPVNQPLKMDISMSPELVAKMSNQEITEVLKYSVRRKHPTPESPFSEDILVPFVVFGSIVVIVFICLYLPYRKSRDVQETVRLMIRENKQIPDGFFESLQTKKLPTAETDLRKGILLSCFGIASSLLILFANPESSHDGSWAIGILPFLVGLGYLGLWRFNSAKKVDA